MIHIELMYAEAERMKPFYDEIKIIERRHQDFLKKRETLYQKFGNRLRNHFVAIENYFHWHTWTDLTPEIKAEVETCYKKHFRK